MKRRLQLRSHYRRWRRYRPWFEVLEDRTLLSGDWSEPNNTFAAPFVLPAQQGVRFVDGLSIDTASDQDWFKFPISSAAHQGEFVQVVFQNAQGDLDLELYDGSDHLLRASYTAQDTETVSLNGLPAGDYYVHIFGHGGATNPQYRLAIDFPGRDWIDATTPNDTRASAYNLIARPSGVNFADNLSIDSATDLDWFTLTTPNPFTADDYLAIYFQQAQGDLDLQLYDSAGTLLATSNGIQDNERISLAGLPAGTYYAKVLGYAGAINPHYKIETKLPYTAQGDWAEPNNVFSSAYNFGTIQGQYVAADLAVSSATDFDWFKFTTTTAAVHGTYVQLQTEHWLGALNISLFDSNGNRFGTTVGTSDTARISLDGRPAGTYYVAVNGISSATNPNYTLTIQAPTALAADWAEPNNNAGAAYHLRTVQGETTWSGLSLDNGNDTDWFDFQLPQQAVAGNFLRVDFDATLGNVDVALYDSQGVIRGRAAGLGNQELIDLGGLPAGTYQVVVYPGTTGSTNPRYALTINVPPAAVPDRFEPNNSAAQPTNLGQLQGMNRWADLSVDQSGPAGDDWYTFSLATTGVAGQYARIDFTDALGDLDLALYDAQGHLVGESRSHDDFESVSLAGLPAGTYQLWVFDGYSYGTNASYTLTINAPQVAAGDWAEPDDSIDTAYNFGLVHGQHAWGHLSIDHGGDMDYYRFATSGTGSSGNYARIDFSDALGDLDLRLFNSSGSMVSYSDGLDDSEQVSLAGLAAGVFYLQVSGYDSATNPSYSVTLVTPDGIPPARDVFEPDDAPSLAADLGPLQGVHVWGNDPGAPLSIDSTIDEDWYRFSLTTAAVLGHQAAITFDHTHGQLTLGLYAGDGTTLLASATRTGDQETISFAGLGAGTYYLRVVGLGGQFNPAYRLNVIAPGTDWSESNPTADPGSVYDLGTLTALFSRTGLSITPGDVDWFRFTTQAAAVQEDAVRIDYDAALGGLDLQLCDNGLNPIGASVGASNTQLVSLAGLPAGTYYLRVAGHTAAVNNPLYALTIAPPAVPAVGWAEPNDSRPDAWDLDRVQGSVTWGGDPRFPLAVYPAGDQDWFSFTTGALGTAGNAVSISFNGFTGDLDLELYDSAGNLLGGSYTSNDTETVSLQGRSAGDFYVRIIGHNNAVNPQYFLTINAPGPITADWTEPNNSRPTATDLRTLNGPLVAQNLSISDPTDVDWFTFQLGAAAVTGNAISVQFDPQRGALELQVYDAGGNLLFDDADVTGNALIALAGQPAGTYYARVAGVGGAVNPQYRLVFDAPLTTGDWAEPNETPGAAYNLGTVSGTQSWNNLSINVSGDQDWCQFTTAGASTAGNSAAIAFDNERGDLDLELYDSGGNRLANSATTNDTEQVSLAGLAAGTYYLHVLGYGGASNPNYGLTISAPLQGGQPDWAEPNDTRAAATDLSQVAGAHAWTGLSIGSSSDQDWFRFQTATAAIIGQCVAIIFDGTLGALGLELYDAGGNLITSATGTTNRDEIGLAGLAAGTYYIRVYGLGGATNPAYSLSINAPQLLAADWAEPNDTQSAAFDLRQVTGTLTSAPLSIHTGSDADWFAFQTANPGTSGDVVQIDFNATAGNLELDLYDAGGNQLGSTATAGAGSQQVALIGRPAGSYYLRVIGVAGATNPSYTLTIVAPDANSADWAEWNDTLATAYNLSQLVSPSGQSRALADAFADTTGTLIFGSDSARTLLYDNGYANATAYGLAHSPGYGGSSINSMFQHAGIGLGAGAAFLAGGNIGNNLLYTNVAPGAVASTVDNLLTSHGLDPLFGEPATPNIVTHNSQQPTLGLPGLPNDVGLGTNPSPFNSYNPVNFNQYLGSTNTLASPTSSYNPVNSTTTYNPITVSPPPQYHTSTSNTITGFAPQHTAGSTNTAGPSVGHTILTFLFGVALLHLLNRSSSGIQPALSLPNLSIDHPGDVDWFKIALPTDTGAAQFARISFDHTAGNLELDLCDASGNVLGSSAVQDDSQQVSLANLPAGVYYLRVQGVAGSTNPSYTLDLSVTTSSALTGDWAEPNDAQSAARDLRTVEGTRVLSNLSIDRGSDVDWFQFTTTATAVSGQYVQINFNNSQGDLDLRLYDAAGNVLDTSAGTGNSEQISLVGRPAGTYYLKVYGYDQAVNPSYTLLLNTPSTSIVPDRLESNDSVAQATPLDTLTGTSQVTDLSITPGDNDYFRFTTVATATPAHTVAITFNQAAAGLALELYAADNPVPVRIGQGSSGTVTLSLNGLQAGTYYVHVAGSLPSTGASYDLYFVLPTAPALTVNDWTVMVYMTASTLAPFAAQDVNEMEAAAAALPPSVKIAALWDQSAAPEQPRFATGNGSQAPWGTTGRAIIQPDGTPYPDDAANVIVTPFDTSIGEEDTGDPNSLVQFAQWVTTVAPARHYALILWDHGGGVNGSNQDNADGTGNDILTVPELAGALQTLQADSLPFDLVGYDACLMGMTEIAGLLAPYTREFVGSEETEGGAGYDYTTALDGLARDPAHATSADLAAGLVLSYQVQYQPQHTDSDTLSATTAGQVAALQAALHDFTSAVLSAAGPGDLTILGAARSGATSFTDSPDFRDLGQVMNAVIQGYGSVASPIKSAAGEVLSALGGAVAFHTADRRQTSGLSIYLPHPGQGISTTYLQQYGRFFSATGWDGFLQAFVNARSAVPDVQPDAAENNDLAALAYNLHALIGHNNLYTHLTIDRPNDEDWYRFGTLATAASNDAVGIGYDPAAGSMSLQLYDAYGDLLAQSHTGAGIDIVPLHNDPAGVYFVRIRGDGVHTIPQYSMNINAPNVVFYTRDWAAGNDVPSKAYDLGLVSSRLLDSGLALDPGQSDWFTFTTPRNPGQTLAVLTVTLTGSDPVTAQLFDAQGNPLTAATGTGQLHLEYPTGLGSSYSLQLTGPSEPTSHPIYSLIFDPTVTSSVALPYADGFQRDDSSDPGLDWAERFGDMALANHQVQFADRPSLATLDGVSSADIRVQADVTVSAAGQLAGLAARYAGPGDTNMDWAGLVDQDGQLLAQIRQNAGGTWTTLASIPVASGAGHIRLDVVGATLLLAVDNQVVAVAYDPTLTVGGVALCGLGGTIDNVAVSAPGPLAAALTPVAEDTPAPPGNTVASVLASLVADPDPGALAGIAVIGTTDTAAGTWQYSLNRGASWLNMGTVGPASARLLRDTDKLRFVPGPNFNGPAAIVFRAWDRTSGTAGGTADVSLPDAVGGATAFSAASGVAVVQVTPVNDRPVLDAGAAPTLTPVAPGDSDPAGDTVAHLIGTAATDVDAGAVAGVAIVQTSGAGFWQYQLPGSPWTDIGPASSAAALLLAPDDRVRFVPRAGFVGTASIGFRAWDQTGGTVGSKLRIAPGSTAFSVAVATAQLPVTDTPPADNTAPALDPAWQPITTSVVEDSASRGDTVASWLAASVADPDPHALSGIAVTGLTGTGNGTWQYSLNGGATWQAIGPTSLANALLLRDTNRIRFLPTRGFAGSATITYHAWDRTHGSVGGRANLSVPDATGGASPFSTDTQTATVTVTPINHRPVLTTTPVPLLTTIAPGATDPAGDSVAHLLGTSVTDPDPGTTVGIVIVQATGRGTWQYQLPGAAWTDLGAVATGAALLLAPEDLVRFVPQPGFRGVVRLLYRAWDETSVSAGTRVQITAGNTAFSTATAAASLTVTAADTAPILATKNVPAMTPVLPNSADPAGDTVARIIAGLITDPDPEAQDGIAITAVTTSLGSWQYSLDGTHWLDVGTVSTRSALLLRAEDHIRFMPSPGARGVAALSFRAWDQTTGGAGTRADVTARGSTAFSTALATALVVVNTAPVLSV
jgi:hypothetical protein